MRSLQQRDLFEAPSTGGNSRARNWSCPAPAPLVPRARFNGPEYLPRRDDGRLHGQILRVFERMRDGCWRTLEELATATGDPVTSVSAQLRHLRKERFGAYTVNRRSRVGALFEYQLLPTEFEP